MLDALVVFYTFVACGLWRQFTKRWLQHQDWWQKWPKLVKLLSQYYTLAFGGFLVLVFDNATATFEALFAFRWANPDLFLVHPENVANMTCPNGSPVTPLNWTHEERHEVRFDDHGVMRVLVLGSCPAVVLTQLIAWTQIFRHLWRIKDSSCRLEDNELRDKAIQIILLPVIYSVVAYNNVIRLMNLFTGVADLCRPEWGLAFAEKKEYTLSLYEANLSMADFYEAVALLYFTQLTVDHIEKTMIGHSKDKDPDHIEVVKKIHTVMSGMVTSGVMSFCLTCLLTFFRGLVLVFYMAWFHTVLPASSEGSLPAMLSGAGLIASTVAIGNVVNVELSFHHELEAFVPGAKFWSTKVIVSIAFIQEAALGLLGNVTIMGESKLSDLQINLLYCSLLSYEVLLVAVLHVKAWQVGVNITPSERGTDDTEEYWEQQKPHHGVEAREPLLLGAE